jgi:hypothetical protein
MVPPDGRGAPSPTRDDAFRKDRGRGARNLGNFFGPSPHVSLFSTFGISNFQTK